MAGFAAAIIALCLAFVPAAAQDEAPPHPGISSDEPLPVDGLLDRLSRAADAQEAKRLERMILEAWQASGSATTDLLFRRAGEALEAEQYARALELLDAIVELNPDFAEGWNMRAALFYRIKEYQRSLEGLGRVLELQPRHFGALSGLGRIFRDLDDNVSALSALRRALEVHPFFGDLEGTVERLREEVEGREI